MKLRINNTMRALFSVMFLVVGAIAAPLDTEDEPSENVIPMRSDQGETQLGSWDSMDTAALRKMLMQLDADDRFNLGRVGRSWPMQEPRGWSLRPVDGRLARQWRADKRQVRFRQCYFNPISCFRK